VPVGGPPVYRGDDFATGGQSVRADKDFAVPLEVIARDEGGIEYKLAASIFGAADLGYNRCQVRRESPGIIAPAWIVQINGQGGLNNS
jgi:hypothetical protein